MGTFFCPDKTFNFRDQMGISGVFPACIDGELTRSDSSALNSNTESSKVFLICSRVFYIESQLEYLFLYTKSVG